MQNAQNRVYYYIEDIRVKRYKRKGKGGSAADTCMITYEEIRNNQEIATYIREADDSLRALGFTEHADAHVGAVAKRCEYLLSTLGFDAHTVELSRIAAHLHDIGNVINRTDHSQSGALMAFRILDRLGMPPADIATVITAIGNHDEGTSTPVNAVAAALILADKSDVRRSRVRNADPASFDIHDRVNYSVTDSRLTVDAEARVCTLSLTIDTAISAIMDYFEIFLGRMLLCRRASERLGLSFSLFINGQRFA